MVESVRLFAQDATEFNQGINTRLGIGTLVDASKCEVVEERNGAFEVELEYPITGELYNQIDFRKLIVCKPNPYDRPQAFRIYDISKPINGMVTIKGEHVSYDLAGYPLGPNKDDITTEPIANVPFEATNMTDAISKINTYSVRDDMLYPNGPFRIISSGTFPDLPNDKKVSVTLPNTARAVIGGDGGIVQKFEGELKYNNFTLEIAKERGRNRGVTISYGKNLKDLTQDANCSNVYTHIYPYWHDESVGFRELAVKVIRIPGTENYPYTKYLPVDLSSEFQPDSTAKIYYPTDAQLTELANRYISDNKLNGEPVINLTISFEMLSQYPEYSEIAGIEDVLLCDTVHVRFPKLGVTATAKVIKTTYNALTGKYVSIDLGEAKNTLTTTISQQRDYMIASAYTPATEGFLKRSMFEAGQKIAGNKGGYVALFDTDHDGEPDEIIITNGHFTDPKQYNGVNHWMWRWNVQGLAFSPTGYNGFSQGDLSVAITNDGKINADLIRTGTLQSIEIQAGSPTGGVWPFRLLSDGTIEISKGEIKMGTKYAVTGGYEWPFHVYNDGKVVATDLHINGGTINVGNRFIVDDDGYLAVYSTVNDQRVQVFSVQSGNGRLTIGNGGLMNYGSSIFEGRVDVNGGGSYLVYKDNQLPPIENTYSWFCVDDEGITSQVFNINRNGFGGFGSIYATNIDDLFSFHVNDQVFEGVSNTVDIHATDDASVNFGYYGALEIDEYKTRLYADNDIFIGRSYLEYDEQTQQEDINSNRRIWLSSGDEPGNAQVPFMYFAEKASGTASRGNTLWRFTSGSYTWQNPITYEDEPVSATDDFPEETFQASGTSVGGIVQINLSTGNVGIHKKLFVYDSIWLGPEESKLVPANWSAIDSQLSTTSENPVMNKVITARMNEVFQSVSNGKAAVASAITDKGVPTASDATFNTMATNIRSIPAGEWDGSVHEEANMKDYYSASDDDVNGGFVDEITIEEVTS